jgi:hypothetical protein
MFFLSLFIQFIHVIFDNVCRENGKPGGFGFAPFGNAADLQPIVASFKDFLVRSVGMQLTNSQVN